MHHGLTDMAGAEQPERLMRVVQRFGQHGFLTLQARGQTVGGRAHEPLDHVFDVLVVRFFALALQVDMARELALIPDFDDAYRPLRPVAQGAKLVDPGAVRGRIGLEQHRDRAAAALAQLGAEGIALDPGARRRAELGARSLQRIPFELAAADGAAKLSGRDDHACAGFTRRRPLDAGDGHQNAGIARAKLVCKIVEPVRHQPASPARLRTSSTAIKRCSGVAGASSFGNTLWPPAAATASVSAENTEMASIKGGSPIALER